MPTFAAESPPDGLTRRQRQVVRAVYRHQCDTGGPPTIRQLRAALGIASPNGVVPPASRVPGLKALARKGWLDVDESAWRGVRLRGLAWRPEFLDTAAGERLRRAVGEEDGP